MNIDEALILLDNLLKPKGLNSIQETVFRHAWEGMGYREMARHCGYDANYLKDVGSKLWKLLSEILEQEVTKSNFRAVLGRYTRTLSIQTSLHNPQTQSEDAVVSSQLTSEANSHHHTEGRDSTNSNLAVYEQAIAPGASRTRLIAHPRVDWGEAVDVVVFYGRNEELSELQKWIVDEDYRLVALLGMGGLGKTTLAVKLAEQLQEQFDYIIWRSLRNTPSVEEILVDFIQFLSQFQETKATLPQDTNGKILRLLEYLRSSRCLLVLDNVETILLGGDSLEETDTIRVGNYLPGYEGYGELFKRVGEVRHKSCLLITSREKPKEFSFLEGSGFPVRSWQLTGLQEAEARKVIQLKGEFFASEEDWSTVIKHYAGNPLALKIVGAAIQDILNGDISKFIEFLNNELLVFDDLRDLLENQFNRLSKAEKEIMYWLAIEREPVPLGELQKNILSALAKQKLPETLRALGQRSLVEKQGIFFTQKPDLMEFVTQQFLNYISEEIITEQLSLLHSHSLVKSQAKDCMKEDQIRLILAPLKKKIIERLGSQANLETHLKDILEHCRESQSFELSYAEENIINILRHLNNDLEDI
ncbi:NB-ARC domain-containing protein [Scytonema sp. NUACC26]|uniref:NB-ARC domain-containing protein n=1 Tax=Scytonema sp. NUACC26 TaxID=3140176 RepID=UPI0034DC2B32